MEKVNVNGIAHTAINIDTLSPIPIAQLTPLLVSPGSRAIKAVVSLTWPYSSATGSIAFLLAEPDFRLRRARGQVRVHFSGSSAKAIAKAGIASGDGIVLCLEGVEWVQDEASTILTPGRGVEFELRFTERLVLKFHSEGSADSKQIDIDHPVAEPEPSAARIPTPEPSNSPLQPVQISLEPDVSLKSIDEWSSPAFLKRSRTSYGSLFEPDYDPFAEEDGTVRGKGRKKTRLSSSWRYTSRSPTPEVEDEVMEGSFLPEPTPSKPAIIMTDEACQTVDLENGHAAELLANFSRQATNIGSTAYSISNGFAHTQLPRFEDGPHEPDSNPIVQASVSGFFNEVEVERAEEPPRSPHLEPIHSDSLPLVSPLLQTRIGALEAHMVHGSVTRPSMLSDSPMASIVGVDEEDIYGASPTRQDEEPNREEFSNLDQPDLTMTTQGSQSESGDIPGDQYGQWKSVNARADTSNVPYFGAGASVHDAPADMLYNEELQNPMYQEDMPEFQDQEPPVSEYPELEDEISTSTLHWGYRQSDVAYPELPDVDPMGSTPYPARAPQSVAMSRSQSARSEPIDLTEDSEAEEIHSPTQNVSNYEEAEEEEEEEEEEEQEEEGDYVDDRVTRGASDTHHLQGHVRSGNNDEDLQSDAGDSYFDEEEVAEDYPEDDRIATPEDNDLMQETHYASHPEEEYSGGDGDEDGAHERDDDDDEDSEEDEPVLPRGEPEIIDLLSSDDEDAPVLPKAVSRVPPQKHVFAHSNESDESEGNEESEEIEESDEGANQDEGIEIRPTSFGEGKDEAIKSPQAGVEDSEDEEIEVSEVEVEDCEDEDDEIPETRFEDGENEEIEIPGTEFDDGNDEMQLSHPGLQEGDDDEVSLVGNDDSEEPRHLDTRTAGEALNNEAIDQPLQFSTDSYGRQRSPPKRGSLFDRMFSMDGASDDPESEPESSEESPFLFPKSEKPPLRSTETEPSTKPSNIQLPTPQDTQVTEKMTSAGQSFTSVVSTENYLEMNGHQATDLNGAVANVSETEILRVETTTRVETMETFRSNEDQDLDAPMVLEDITQAEDHFGQLVVGTEAEDSRSEMQDIEPMVDIIDEVIGETEVVGSHIGIQGIKSPKEMLEQPRQAIEVVDSEIEVQNIPLPVEMLDAPSGLYPVSVEAVDQIPPALPPFTIQDSPAIDDAEPESYSRIEESLNAFKISWEEPAESHSQDEDDLMSQLERELEPRSSFKPALAVKEHIEVAQNSEDTDTLGDSLVPEELATESLRRSSRLAKPTSYVLNQTENIRPSTPVKARGSSEARSASKAVSPVVLLDARATPRGHDASIELALAVSNSPTKPVAPVLDLKSSPATGTKFLLSRSLRTELSQFTQLKVIRHHLNQKLDVLAIATTTPPEPMRAKGGPRHYQISFNITDQSIAPSSVAEVSIFRPYKEALPTVRAGDGVLLRNFQAISLRNRGFGLRSMQDAGSSWAVFKADEEEPEVRGPPVEFGEGEKNHIRALAQWFADLDDTSMRKLERANGDKAEKMSGSGVGSSPSTGKAFR